MTVRLRWGGATHVGQHRDANQDSMLLGPDVFVVADGMGGHQGGEVASALAIQSIEAVAGRLPGASVGELVAAVQDANDTVYERSTQDPSLSGMGTTVVAFTTVVEGGEERLAIVNVGDSRAYRLSGGELQQVTEDHSLVGELVRDGRISREEARTHPQKNIVTRAVGIDQLVQVDDFQILPHAGDRYLLCSDGLTDEVTESDIATVLRTVDDPDEAAQDLVRRANAHGGRDNITIVIIDVVDDGGVSAEASAAVPARDDTQAYMALPDDRAHEQGDDDDSSGASPVPGDSESDRSRAPRALTVRSILFVLVLLAVIGAGAYLVNDYATGTYFVTVDDDEVSIFRGRPGGVLWIDPELVDRTGIDERDVPAEFRSDLREGVDASSLAAARRYVTRLEDRIEDLAPPPSTTTTTTTTSSTTTAPAPTSAP